MNNTQAIEQITERIVYSPQPVVVLGIGIPGSGKSTLLQTLGTELSSPIVDVDAIRREALRLKLGKDTVNYIDENIDQEVSKRVVEGRAAFVDSTNCHAEIRKVDIGRFRSLGALTIGAVWLDVPLETAINRNAKRPANDHIAEDSIRRMSMSLSMQAPSQEEGFDWVERLDQLNRLRLA